MLKEMRGIKGLSQQQLADALSSMGPRWTQPDVSRIESGKIRPTIDKIKQAANFFGVTQGTILGDEQNHKKVVEKELQPSIAGSIGEFGPDKVSLYGYRLDQNGILVLDMSKEIDRVSRHPNQQGREDSYAVDVIDDTMVPRYMPQEKAYPVRNSHPAEGQDCYIFFNNGSAQLRKYIKTSDREIICRQLNPSKEWKFPRSEIKAIHAVVGRG